MPADGVAAPNPNDHALVIGIRRYADAEAGWNELKGPDNDAAAVAEWLRRPDGGGLPDENVRVVCSARAPDPFVNGRGEPGHADLLRALNEIAQLPKTYHQYAGRRLYVYISGHGFATMSEQAGLLCADAALADPLIVDVTSFTCWMREDASFEQLVLWVDACAIRVAPSRMTVCELAPSRSPNAPNVRMFEGFAAGVGLTAVEIETDGTVHGAFTYALLEGLNGAAPTPVTGHTLSDYLRNELQQFMSETDRRRSKVAHEPAFGRTDPLEFGHPPRTTYPVTIHFGEQCVNQQATVGFPPQHETIVDATRQWRLDLVAGPNAVFVDALGLGKTFHVGGMGNGSVQLG